MSAIKDDYYQPAPRPPVTPALAAIQRTGDGVAHGALSADRVIVTRDGRLVVV